MSKLLHSVLKSFQLFLSTFECTSVRLCDKFVVEDSVWQNKNL